MRSDTEEASRVFQILIICGAKLVIEIWTTRDASAVSLKTYSLTVTCFVLWTADGVMTTAWPIIVANACALLMSAGVLAMKWRFRER